MKNVTLADAKEAARLFNATEEVLKLVKLKNPNSYFVPSQFKNVAKFALELQNYLKSQQKVSVNL